MFWLFQSILALLPREICFQIAGLWRWRWRNGANARATTIYGSTTSTCTIATRTRTSARSPKCHSRPRTTNTTMFPPTPHRPKTNVITQLNADAHAGHVLYLSLAHSFEFEWTAMAPCIEYGMALVGFGVIIALICILCAWCVWARIPFAALLVCDVLSALCAILRYAQSSSSTIGSASTRTARRWGSLRPPRRRRSAAATAATARARHGHRPKTTNATIFLKSVFVQHIPPTPHRPAHLNADADTGEPELFSGDWRCQRALPTVARCAQRVWSSPSTTTTTMRDRAPRRAMAGRGVGAQIRALRK